MKIFKSFIVMAIALTAGFFASCSEEGAWDAYDTTSEPTYSFEQSASNYVLSTTDTVTQVVVKVFRNNANGNVTLPLDVKVSSNILTYDTAAVTFENGKDFAEFIVNVDYDNIKVGTKYTASVAFVVDSLNYFEHNASLTGNSSASISLQVEYSWQSIGKALYTEDVAGSPGFGLECLTYEVEVEQAVENPNIIRMKNAYGAAFPYNEPGDYDTKKDYYITFNCEDPEGVYIDGWCEMGMDWGYGMFSMTSYGYYMMANGYPFETVKAAGLMGTLDENLCITFPVKGLVMQMADWGMAYANQNGAFNLDLSTTTLAE
ncbi:MAG: hypothetical protein J6Q73_06765 [Bacteroidaceae bacterium]|nr:hypothetical protein [Bacteroidaceae bacterium]